MEDELKLVHEHMLNLGLGALTHAHWHAAYHSFENDNWAQLSVLQAAHAAEILIKARIAREHPLLIFEHLPKPNGSDSNKLNFKHLIENGRTYQYADLPDRLWAATGLRLPNISTYQSFGRLRNAVQHFASPVDVDVSKLTLEFTFGVIDPLIHECWGLFAVDYNEDHEPYTYFVAHLIRRGIRFLVSPGVIEYKKWIEFDWPKNDIEYKNEMSRRLNNMSRRLMREKKTTTKS